MNKLPNSEIIKYLSNDKLKEYEEIVERAYNSKLNLKVKCSFVNCMSDEDFTRYLELLAEAQDVKKSTPRKKRVYKKMTDEELNEKRQNKLEEAQRKLEKILNS